MSVAYWNEELYHKVSSTKLRTPRSIELFSCGTRTLDSLSTILELSTRIEWNCRLGNKNIRLFLIYEL